MSDVSNDAALDWMRQYQSQKRKCDEENGVLRNILKRAKSDGINTKAMIAAVNATKQEPDSVQQDLRDTLRYMALRRLPVSRDDLYAGWDVSVTDKTSAEDQKWDAEDAGYRSGRHGAKIEDCPYPHGSELAVAWVSYWRRGQEAIAREMGPGTEIASTSKARPKRASEEAEAEAAALKADVMAELDEGASVAGVERAVGKRGKAKLGVVPGRKARAANGAARPH